MAAPYIYERQTEYWTSRQVEESLLDAGFDVIVFPLSQIAEAQLPADFIFFDRNTLKLFGFQYKALYHNGGDFWPVDSAQHQTLTKYPWVSYCLSELKDVRDHRLALHQARIVEISKVSPPRITRSDFYNAESSTFRTYRRWGAFLEAFRACDPDSGIRVESREHLMRLLFPDPQAPKREELSRLVVDVFLADLELRRILHFSPQLGPLERRPGE